MPALIELMHQPNAASASTAKQRRYASYQLDRMDRQRPQKAISTAPDDRVRAEIIHAYGETRALDAVEAILGQVDSPAHRVRARGALGVAALRHRQGAAAGAQAQAQAAGRQGRGGGEAGLPDLSRDRRRWRSQKTPGAEERPGDQRRAARSRTCRAKQMTDELFDYYDKKRAAEWDGAFNAAKAESGSRRPARATDEYASVLAHDPNYARRAEMAHAFARRPRACAPRECRARSGCGGWRWTSRPTGRTRTTWRRSGLPRR